eukprot:TRINITY_DN42234_c0_g1_i1.p1 TRINITY_DN42234_c0_g1~~TRINITY_DN42234_c0_g1_i1.p1  ORF type:complete len:1015 (-),score=107.10 TRINITY_DN42234_c0_g1_i1:581-3625(-)
MVASSHVAANGVVQTQVAADIGAQATVTEPAGANTSFVPVPLATLLTAHSMLVATLAAMPQRLFPVLACWLLVAAPTLQKGPRDAPCTFGALVLILGLAFAAAMATALALCGGGSARRGNRRCDSITGPTHPKMTGITERTPAPRRERACSCFFVAVALVVMHFGERWALDGTLRKGSGAKKAMLFSQSNCVLAAVLEQEAHFRAFDVLLGAALPAALVIVCRSTESPASLGKRTDSGVASVPCTLEYASAGWALAEAVACSFYPYNYVAGRPHNVDRTVVVSLGIAAACWRPGLRWLLVPWCMIMAGQFSPGIWDEQGWMYHASNWGVCWQMIAAVEVCRLIGLFFPRMGPQPAELSVRLLLGTHYLTPWAHKVQKGWLSHFGRSGPGMRLWHFLASGAYVHGLDEAWGPISRVTLDVLLTFARKNDWLFAATAFHAQLFCGLGIALSSGLVACVCSLAQGFFHVVVAFTAGHVFWGHFLACVGVAYCEGMRWKRRRQCTPTAGPSPAERRSTSVTEAADVAEIDDAEKPPPLHDVSMVLRAMFLFVCNLHNVAILLDAWLDRVACVGEVGGRFEVPEACMTVEAHAKTTTETALRRLGERLLVLYASVLTAFGAGLPHPAVPTMNFWTAGAHYVWRVRLQLPWAEDVAWELDATAFSPFATQFARGDPSFLHPRLPLQPWMQNGESGASDRVTTCAVLAAGECPDLSAEGSERRSGMPSSGIARCYAKLAYMKSAATGGERALKRFENLVGQLLQHIAGNFAGSATLWPPFRAADWLHREGWLAALPRDPWCCHGHRRGARLGAVAAALGATKSDRISKSVGLEVWMEESWICENRSGSLAGSRSSGGSYRHVPAFAGSLYRATAVQETLARHRRRRKERCKRCIESVNRHPHPHGWDVGDASATERLQPWRLKRRPVPELETEMQRCDWVFSQVSRYQEEFAKSSAVSVEAAHEASGMNEDVEAPPRGNPLCWIDGYGYAFCCAEHLGHGGNAACWDDVFNYDLCCQPDRR